ncbi:MAG: hypothetical protein ABJP82_14685 [Hyphomicrobiales bacterium]
MKTPAISGNCSVTSTNKVMRNAAAEIAGSGHTSPRAGIRPKRSIRY